MGQSSGKTRCRLPGTLPVQKHRCTPGLSSSVTAVQCMPTGRLTTALVSRVFTGAQLCRLAIILSGRIIQGL